MFIEVTEALRCPGGHPPTQHCVLIPERLEDRIVVEGVVGCPVCREEYAIADGVVAFGPPPESDPGPALDPEAVRVLLGLDSPGGLIVLVGAVGGAAAGVAAALEGVHVLALNGPDDLGPAAGVTRLTSPADIPLRDGTARGIVLDGGLAYAPWLAEAARVTRAGGRVVVCAAEAAVPECDAMAAAHGFWVGTRRPRKSAVVPLRHSP
jgi:hypothetical protein